MPHKSGIKNPTPAKRVASRIPATLPSQESLFLYLRHVPELRREHRFLGHVPQLRREHREEEEKHSQFRAHQRPSPEWGGTEFYYLTPPTSRLSSIKTSSGKTYSQGIIFFASRNNQLQNVPPQSGTPSAHSPPPFENG